LTLDRRELSKYVAVGVVITAANIALYAVFTALVGLGHKVAYTLMYICGLLLRFVLERHFVFRRVAGASAAGGQLIRFSLLVSAIYVVGIGLFRVVEVQLGINHFAILALVVASTTLLGFAGSKYLVFSGSRP
jgi:putative flippase GtrA